MTRRKGQIIGANIKRLRTMKGVTQQEVSNAIFITRSCLGNYEIGTRIPNDDTLSSLADYFNVDTHELTDKSGL